MTKEGPSSFATDESITEEAFPAVFKKLDEAEQLMEKLSITDENIKSDLAMHMKRLRSTLDKAQALENVGKDGGN